MKNCTFKVLYTKRENNTNSNKLVDISSSIHLEFAPWGKLRVLAQKRALHSIVNISDA